MKASRTAPLPSAAAALLFFTCKMAAHAQPPSASMMASNDLGYSSGGWGVRPGDRGEPVVSKAVKDISDGDSVEMPANLMCQYRPRTNYNYVQDPPFEARSLNCHSFQWTIHNFSTMEEEQVYSPIYEAIGHQWQLLVFPKGNNAPNVSVYLSYQPNNCDLNLYFSVSIDNLAITRQSVSQGVTSSSVSFNATTTFTAEVFDWGWQEFLPLLSRGALRGDSLELTVHIELLSEKCNVPHMTPPSLTLPFMELDLDGSLLQTPLTHSHRHIVSFNEKMDQLNASQLQLLLLGQPCLEASSGGMSWQPSNQSGPVQQSNNSATEGGSKAGDLIASFRRPGQLNKLTIATQGGKLRPQESVVATVATGMEVLLGAWTKMRKKRSRGRKCVCGVALSGRLTKSANSEHIMVLQEGSSLKRQLPETVTMDQPWHDFSAELDHAAQQPNSMTVVSLVSTEVAMDWSSDSRLHLYGSKEGVPWLTQFDLYADFVIPVMGQQTLDKMHFFQQVVLPGVPPKLGISLWYKDWVDEWQKGTGNPLSYEIGATVTSFQEVPMLPKMVQAELVAAYKAHYYVLHVEPLAHYKLTLNASNVLALMHSAWADTTYGEDLVMEMPLQEGGFAWVESIQVYNEHRLLVHNLNTTTTKHILVTVLTNSVEHVKYNISATTVTSTETKHPPSERSPLRGAMPNGSGAYGVGGNGALDSGHSLQHGALTWPLQQFSPQILIALVVLLLAVQLSACWFRAAGNKRLAYTSATMSTSHGRSY